jgi:hypothetical protein
MEFGTTLEEVGGINMWVPDYFLIPPTKAQIDFAEEIASVLEIDFPTCSKEFNKWSYSKFISNHIDRFKEIQREYSDPEDEMAWWDPHAEGGY